MSDPAPGPRAWPPAPEWAEHIRHARNAESGIRARVYSVDLVTSRGTRATLTEGHIWDGRTFHQNGPTLSIISEVFDADDVISVLSQAAEHAMGSEAA